MNERQPVKHVYTVVERGERAFWTKIGAAFANRNGSTTVRLDALPMNGKLVIRDENAERDVESSPRSARQ